MKNLKKSSIGLDENMNAAKENFLLKGYYKRKAKAVQDKKDEAEKIKSDEQKETDKTDK
jgi:phospholipid/cholesterol/gamma-HCH transport system substrate-binding protein